MRFLPVLFEKNNKQWVMFMTEKPNESGEMAKLFDLKGLKVGEFSSMNLEEAKKDWKDTVSFSRLKLFAVPLYMSGEVYKKCKATGITMIPKKRFMFVNPENNNLRLADITDLSLDITIS